MPKLKESAEAKANRRTREIIAGRMAYMGWNNDVLAKKWGTTRQTVTARKKAPEKITLRELRILARDAYLTNEQIIEIVRTV